MTLLYHLGIVELVARVMQWTMGTSGAETFSVAGNVFVGQTEAPLLVKPFVEGMTTSELHALMTGGFATVAGGVVAAYVGMLAGHFPDIVGHLMAASVMSAPAARVAAKLMYPEDGVPSTAGIGPIEVEKPDANAVDAVARGASEGLARAERGRDPDRIPGARAPGERPARRDRGGGGAGRPDHGADPRCGAGAANAPSSTAF